MKFLGLFSLFTLAYLCRVQHQLYQ